jgi:hypothetical protein
MADPPKLHDLRHEGHGPETWDGTAWVPLARPRTQTRGRGAQAPQWSWLNALAPLVVLAAIVLSSMGVLSSLEATIVIICVVAFVLGSLLVRYARKPGAE